jgi:hypothetical protein
LRQKLKTLELGIIKQDDIPKCLFSGRRKLWQ